MSEIVFKPRWKEELIAKSNEGILIFELTMGVLHVYFPSQDKWLVSAPNWAKQKWKIYLIECEKWCENNNISISIVDDGAIYEEKNIQ